MKIDKKMSKPKTVKYLNLDNHHCYDVLFKEPVLSNVKNLLDITTSDSREYKIILGPAQTRSECAVLHFVVYAGDLPGGTSYYRNVLPDSYVNLSKTQMKNIINKLQNVVDTWPTNGLDD